MREENPANLVKEDRGICSRPYFYFFVVFVSVWVNKGMCAASHMPAQAICQNLALGKSSSARLLLLVLCSWAGIVWKYVKS